MHRGAVGVSLWPKSRSVKVAMRSCAASGGFGMAIAGEGDEYLFGCASHVGLKARSVQA